MSFLLKPPWINLGAWFVHLLTASGLIVGLFACCFLLKEQYHQTFLCFLAAIVIDGVDGPLARVFNVKKHASLLDGNLMDNIVDFLNYTFLPCLVFLLHPELLYPSHRFLLVSFILITSIFGFSRKNAKTADNFFLGFPNYWNIVAIFMFLYIDNPAINTGILLILSLLTLAPIKFLHPFRLNHLALPKWVKIVVISLTILFFGLLFLCLLGLSKSITAVQIFFAGYITFYAVISLLVPKFSTVK